MREVVELRAADEHRVPGDVPLVEVWHGERDAVGADDDLGALEERGPGRHEHQLHGPVPELRGRAVFRVSAAALAAAGPLGLGAGLIVRRVVGVEERPERRARA